MSETKLEMKWSKREKDLLIKYPKKCDGSLIHSMVSSPRHHPLPLPHGEWDKSILDELKERGYDITTLKFSIKKLDKNTSKNTP